jgi:acetyltransferase EpsM
VETVGEEVTALTIIGGGEHARVVVETARSRSDLWNVDGFADPQPCEDTQRRLGVTWIGDDDAALARSGERLYVLGIGAIGVGDTRRTIVARYAGARFAAIAHANAWVSPTAQLGIGVVVFAGAVIQSGARIGAHVVVGSGAIVEHDVALGDLAQLGPGVVIGGGATIGSGSYLGLGACIRDHVTIGSNVMVAMGAVVTANVADGAVVVGVPARSR